MLVATLANHLLAAAAGFYVSGLLDALWFRYLVGASFLAMAVWVLIPDKAPGGDTTVSRHGVFLTTVIAFFIVEMGDKTQIATAALAARFSSIWIVASGTTLGMMLANIPAVYFGQAITRIVPLAAMRYISAAIYAVLGVASLAQTAGYAGLRWIKGSGLFAAAAQKLILDVEAVLIGRRDPAGLVFARLVWSADSPASGGLLRIRSARALYWSRALRRPSSCWAGGTSILRCIAAL